MAAPDSADSSCRRRALALTRRIGQEMRPDMYHQAVSRGHRRTMNDFIAPSPVPDACRSPSSAPPPARPTPPGSGGWPGPAAPPAAWARACPRSPGRSQRSLPLVPEDVQPHGVGVPCDRETLTDRDTREAECRRVCGAARSRCASQGGYGHDGAGRGGRCGVGRSMAPESGQQQLQQPFEERSDMFCHVVNLHGVGDHAPGPVGRSRGSFAWRGCAPPHELPAHGNPEGTANGEPRKPIWGTPFPPCLGNSVPGPGIPWERSMPSLRGGSWTNARPGEAATR